MFKRSEVVRIASYPLTGGTDWSETGRIVKHEPTVADGGWYVVRFDRGGTLCVHTSRLKPAIDVDTALAADAARIAQDQADNVGYYQRKAYLR